MTAERRFGHRRPGQRASATAPDGRTIWLRAEPEAAGKKDDSIYRYDRAGLLMALKIGSGGEGPMNACSCWS